MNLQSEAESIPSPSFPDLLQFEMLMSDLDIKKVQASYHLMLMALS